MSRMSILPTINSNNTIMGIANNQKKTLDVQLLSIQNNLTKNFKILKSRATSFLYLPEKTLDDFNHQENKQTKPQVKLNENDDQEKEEKNIRTSIDSMDKSVRTTSTLSISDTPKLDLEISYCRERILLYNLLRKPRGFWAITYHVSLIFIILMAFFVFSLWTIPAWTESSRKVLRYIDSFILVLVILEFGTMLWSSYCVPKYRGFWGRINFLTSLYCFFDLIIIFATTMIIYTNNSPYISDDTLLWFRFGQWFHILRLGYRFKPWRTMSSVIWTQRYQFIITFYMCLVWLIFVTLVMYQVEKNNNNSDQPSSFNSLPQTFWWSIVSLFTIGYGDMTPSSSTGKFLASIFFFLFIFQFALPAGILSTGLALKIQDNERLKNISKRRTAAARLIQSFWRYHHTFEQKNLPVMFARLSRYTHESDRHVQSPELICLRFILLVKFQRTRKIFLKAIRPYDIGDVMEQYAAGHDEVVDQVKQLEICIRKLSEQIEQNSRLLVSLADKFDRIKFDPKN